MAERKSCLVCGKPASAEHAPFCSARCSDVDLGRWLTGTYRLPGDATEDSGDDLPQEQE